LTERGAIRATVAKRFPMSHAADAHAFLEASRPHGAVVIDVVEIHAPSFSFRPIARETRKVA
jgi:hypothetical protein